MSRVYSHKFQKIGHIGIIRFVCVGKDIQKYMQYEVSLTV